VAPPPSGDASAVVAKWVGGRLTAQQVRERVLDQKRAAGLETMNEEQARAFADAALRDELLATEAKKRGLEHDAHVDAAVSKALAARLMELEFDDSRKQAEVSEADVAAYYQKHKDEFVRPERVRFSQVTASGEIDLGLMTRTELEAKVGAEKAAAAWPMVKAGEVSRGLKVTAREGPLEVSLEEARPKIRSRIWYERRDAAMKKFVDALRTNLALSVDEAELGKALR
jgi:hypothetical protein